MQILKMDLIQGFLHSYLNLSHSTEPTGLVPPTKSNNNNTKELITVPFQPFKVELI